MRKRAAIAVIAMAGTLALAPYAVAETGKKKLAAIPGMVPPPMMPGVAVPLRAVPGVGTAVQQALKGSYPSNHYQRGLYLKQKGDLDGALIEFCKAVQENPQNVKSFYEQAVIFRAKKYNKLAQSALQQALAVKPDYHEARMLLATVHLEDGELSQAAHELMNSLGIGSLPSLIQTPHGKMKMPDLNLPKQVAVPATVPAAPRMTPPALPGPDPAAAQAKPKTDAFEAKQENNAPGGLNVTELLKGIPGFGGDAPDGEAKQPKAPEPPRPAESAFETKVEEAGGAIARQVEAIRQQVGGKRKKKARVASWLDNFLDRGAGGGELPRRSESAPATAGANAIKSAVADAHTINPLKIIEAARFAGRAEDGGEDDVARVRDEAPNRLPEASRSVEERTAEPKDVHDNVTADTSPMTDEGAAESNLTGDNRTADARQTLTNDSLPLPPADNGILKQLDISHLFRRAMSWLPLPMFKPLAEGAPPAPKPVSIAQIVPPPVPAPPVLRAPESAAAMPPTLGPRSNVMAPILPAPLPSGPTAAPPAPPTASAQPLPPNTPSPLDDVLSMLPKDIAASVQKVLGPEPMEISPQEVVAPPVLDIAARQVVPNAPAPSLVYTDKPAYENLVTAQVASPAPNVVQQSSPATSATQPGPQPVAAKVPRAQPVASTAQGPQSVAATAPIPQPFAARAQAAPQPLAGAAQPVAPLPQPIVMAQPIAKAIAQVLPAPMAQAIAPAFTPHNQTPPALPSPTARGTGSGVVTAPQPARIAHATPISPIPMAPLPASVRRSTAPGTTPAASPPMYVPTGTAPTPWTPNAKAAVWTSSAAPVPWIPASNDHKAAPNLAPVAMPEVPTGGSAPTPIPSEGPARMVPNAVPLVAGPAQAMPVLPQNFPKAPQFDPTAAIPMPPPQVVNSPVARKLSSQGFKFVAPAIVGSRDYLLSAAKAPPTPTPVAKPAAPPKPVPAQPAPPEDEFAKRMKYLLANGTASLRPGEAFMFSEETGEGVLFLPSGSVRRKIAQPKDHDEVARLRRPDIVDSQGDVTYQLSLLGKIIKPQPAQPAQQTAPTYPIGNSEITTKDLFRQDDGILGWLRNVFKF